MRDQVPQPSDSQTVGREKEGVVVMKEAQTNTRVSPACQENSAHYFAYTIVGFIPASRMESRERPKKARRFSMSAAERRTPAETLCCNTLVVERERAILLAWLPSRGGSRSTSLAHVLQMLILSRDDLDHPRRLLTTRANVDLNESC